MGKKASLQFGVVQLTPDVAWALARCPTRSLKFTRLMDISQKEIEALRNQSIGNTNVGKANETILIREINAPRDGWRVVGYADDHVEVIKPE